MSKVAVFGVGPSGMVAGWAALIAGHDVTFYSNTIYKSTIYGCQYLQAPITMPKAYKIGATRVEYKVNGDMADYWHKIYGPHKPGLLSMSVEDSISTEQDAWDLRETYNTLFDLISQRRQVSLVAPVKIDNSWIQEHTGDLSEYAHVISTIPAYALCKNACYHHSQEGHLFRSRRIMAAGATVTSGNPDLVELDATSEVPWYRRATVFGYTTMEWPVNRLREIPRAAQAVEVHKPITTECDCHPEIVRLGRYGAWNNEVLVHNVFESTEALMRGEYVS